MFERFTDKARRVVVLAQEQARMLGHNYIGTEHLLLGLIHQGDGIAAKALTSMGLSLERVRDEVESIIGRGTEAPTQHIPFTPRAKRVLEFSLKEGLQLGHNHIGTEHLLLGLIREGEGVGAQVLVRLGAELSATRQRVIELISGYPGGVPPDDPAMAIMHSQVVARAVAHVAPPACPTCHTSLTDTLACKEVVAAGGPRPVLIAYCSRCGHAIGTVQGDA